MNKNFPLFPSVSNALSEARARTFRGNTFGQFDSYNSFTDTEKEIASRFNASEELKVLRERRAAILQRAGQIA